MVKNEKGSALLTVMLMLLIFTTLGLVIMSVSINGAKRTEIREDEIITNIDALTNVKEGIAQIEGFVQDENSLQTPATSIAYNKRITEFITAMESNPKYSIVDISSEYNVGDSQTRIFQVSSKTNSKINYSQKVYITAMPSYLKYALGSRASLTMNGSVLINGDIYAKNSLNISNHTTYKYDSNNKSKITKLPAFVEKGNITIDSENSDVRENISLCNSNAACYETINNELMQNTTLWKQTNSIADAFSYGVPTINKDKTEFIDIDVYQTFIDKLIFSGFSENTFNKNMTKDEISNALTDNFQTNKLLDPLTSFDEIKKSSDSIKSFYYEGDAFIDTNDLTIDDYDWLIINGDAHFESEGNSQMKVKANILVTENVTMQGNLSLSSVMYVLGNTTINNANIDCNDCENVGTSNEQSTFILITDGELELARINKFSSAARNKNIINGFLYTTQNANIYGVGSLINVNGGIFSQEDLIVNGYRGDVKDSGSDLEFTPEESHLVSRLSITNDKRLFITQLHALPKVEKLDTITDRIEKIK